MLLALFDASHQFHPVARAWLGANIKLGWASCPLTQNGLIRVLSQPGYPNRTTPTAAIARLREATQASHHEFWADSVSVTDKAIIDGGRIHGPKQLTDVYLLALSVHHQGRFVTFDDTVPLSAVPGAKPDHLVVL